MGSNPTKRTMYTEAQKRHYEKNKALYKQRAIASRNKLVPIMRAWVQDLKESVACADCDGRYHYSVMDFDHIGTDKANNVATLINSGCSWKRLFDEIMKCELVCSNCHRLRTWKRYNGMPV